MKKGFTLLEVMIAITILTVAVGGSFALIQQNLISASINQTNLIGYYLAQEGLEIVKNIRDNNWLNRRTWNDGLPEGDYQVDYNSVGLAPYSANDFLKISNSGFYGYSSGAQTVFKRKITIKGLGEGKMKASVIVEWEERGRTHKTEVSEYLYNWYGYEGETLQSCYLEGEPQTCDGAAATALNCTIGDEGCRRCDAGVCTFYTSLQHDCPSGYECDESGQCSEAGGPVCSNVGAVCSTGSDCCSGNCYVDADEDGYAPSFGTKTCKLLSPSFGVDYDDNNSSIYPGTVCNGDCSINDTDGTCGARAAGENSLAACTRCDGVSLTHVNISDYSDSEGLNTCDGTCAAYCGVGSCINSDTSIGTCIISDNTRVSSGGDGSCTEGVCISDNWGLDYNHRKHFTVNGASEEQSNYQLKLVVYKGTGTDLANTTYLNNKALNWPNDIRFTKSDGVTLLDYWIESTTTVSSSVWVEFDSLPASSPTTFYIYYGNASVGTASNGGNTFLFFDDFSDNNYTNNPTWTVGAGTFSADSGYLQQIGNSVGANIYSTDISIFSGTTMLLEWDNMFTSTFCIGNAVGLSDISSVSILGGYAEVCDYAGTYSIAFNYNGSSWSETHVVSKNIWHHFEVYFNGSLVKIDYDHGLYSNESVTSSYYANNVAKISVGGWQHQAGSSFDNIRVRKYASVEPAWGAWGSEE